jgi:hypothetical protein
MHQLLQSEQPLQLYPQILILQHPSLFKQKRTLANNILWILKPFLFRFHPPIRDPKMMIATAAKPTRSESVSKTESGVSQQKTVQQQPRVRRRVTPVLATTGCPIDQQENF